MSAVPQKPRFQFQPARREHKRARIALLGPAGSGKTLTALLIASALGERIALIDAEHGSSACYAPNEHGDGGIPFESIELGSYSPMLYVEAIEAAAAQGFDVLIIDGISPAWAGPDGALEQVDQLAARSKSNNKFFAWRTVTPQHNALVEAMLACPMHLIATCRVKTEYVIEDVVRDGTVLKVPRKIGMAPIQREGLDYEFDIVGELTLDHEYIVTKTRCSRFDENIITRPGVEFGEQVLGWLREGSEPAQRARVMPAPRPERAERTEGYERPDERRYDRAGGRNQPPPRAGSGDGSGPRYDQRSSSRPRHASDARRPATPPAPPSPPAAAKPQPSAAPASPSAPTDVPDRPQGETEPSFRYPEWAGASRWNGRPLREGDVNSLKTYAEALHWAKEAPRNRSRLRAIEAHLEEVNALLRDHYAADRADHAAHDQREHREQDANGPRE